MVIIDVVIFIIACVVLVKSADFSVKSITNIAHAFRMSEFVISFLVVGIISTFPEFFVSVVAAVKGASDIGLGTVLGGNIADLTIVIAVVIFLGGPIHIGSKALRYDFV